MIFFLFLLFFPIYNHILVLAGPTSTGWRPQKAAKDSHIHAPTPAPSRAVDLKRRQTTSHMITCGYKGGDPNQPRTADSGFDCRTDTVNRLWGFCSTTVIAATDCGLAGKCVDSHACTSGCGIFGNSKVTTFTCSGVGADFCSSAILTAAPDQTYTYIACGASAAEDELLALTTPAETTTSSISSSSSPPESTTQPSSSDSTTSTQSRTPAQLESTSTSPTSTSTDTFSSSPPTSTPSSSVASSSAVPTSSRTPVNNTGAIVGGVIAGLALMCFVGLGVFFLRRYKGGTGFAKMNHSQASTPPDYSQTAASRTKNRYSSRYGGLHKNPWGDKRGPAELPTYPSGNFRN